jgi:hypothetical protein
VQYGAHYGSSGDANSKASPPAALEICEVPEEWQKHAHEPWRVIFPDLDWKSPVGE